MFNLWMGERVHHEEFIDTGRGAARAEDARVTPTQSHISPSIPVYEDQEAGADSAARRGSVRGGGKRAGRQLMRVMSTRTDYGCERRGNHSKESKDFASKMAESKAGIWA